MSDNKLQLTTEKKEELLKKLKQEFDPETAVAYIKEGRSELEENILAAMGSELTEAEKNLWFPENEIKLDLEKITSDLRDVHQWREILKRYKDGSYSEDQMVDFISLSHVSVTEEPNPINVLERQVRDGLKSRTGATLVKRLVGAVSNAWDESVSDLIKLLPEESQSKFKRTFLLTAAEKSSDNSLAVLPLNEEIHDFVKNELALITPDYTEQMVKELFVGEILYDRLIELDYEELKAKLSDPDDLDFSTIRTVIVDAGYEGQHKASTRNSEATLSATSTNDKQFVVYIAWLKNIFEGFKSGTNSEERGIDKFRLKGEITHEQFTHLMSLIQERYYRYIYGRWEIGSLEKGWVEHATLNAFSKLPEYNIDPVSAVRTVQNLVSYTRTVANALGPSGGDDGLRQELFQQMGESLYTELSQRFLKNDNKR